jgi:hypothetical protein
MTRLLAGLILPTLLLLHVGVAAGHGTGLPWIWVEDEHVSPGQRFTAVVVDFEPNGTVALELVADGGRAALGAIPSEGDGHGEAELQVPTDFPHGYAELVGTDEAGGQAVTLVYVGEAVAGAGPSAPGSPATPQKPEPPAAWWADPSVLVLALLVIGAATAALLTAIHRVSRASRGHSPGA